MVTYIKLTKALQLLFLKTVTRSESSNRTLLEVNPPELKYP